MLKNRKRLTNGLLVSQAACSSMGPRDNVVDLPSNHAEKTTPALSKSYSFDNLSKVFADCGMDIDGDTSNILQTDQAMFVQSLSSKLYSNRATSAQDIDCFLTNLKQWCQNNDNFRKALSPTVTSKNCDIARGSIQESMMRLLLQIDRLQVNLSNYLLDKLAELGLQSNDLDLDVEPITWVKLILQPFRFLNFIIDSKTLCERLFDVIFSSNEKIIQQEVIICLPDIITDSEHLFASTELSKLLQSDVELMPPCLDALTNLSVQSDIRRGVRQNLIDSLKTSTIEYLPNIVKFLLNTCDSNSFDEVIDGLRRELFANNSVATKHTINEETIDVENLKVLIFSNIRNCLLANKPLAEAWMKNISQISVPVNCKPLDIIITLILYDICAETTRKTKLETMFRNRIKSEFFTESLINKLFENFTQVVIEYFSSLMSMLSKLLKSVDSVVNEFVSVFYLSSFANTDQPSNKIIVTELLAYIGAGDANDSRTALHILSQIALKYPQKIKPLASMLRGLLNKLIDLSITDAQQLMDTLCCIAFTEQQTEDTSTSLLKDDITSLIEKRISSSHLKYVRIGIIGAVMAIKHLALCHEDESNEWPDKSSEDFDENFLTYKARKALPFLRLIVDGTRVLPEAQGFGFDLFSLMLMNCRNLDKSLLFYMSMVMKENMKKYFLICSDEVKTIELMETSLKFALNEDDEFVVLNLTPTIVEERRNKASAGLRMYSIVLPALLRLIRGLEYSDLREIDGLLECPTVMPHPKIFHEFGMQTPEVQVVAMDSLFHLANWLREIVNCFARIIKQPAGKKVLMRLRTIIWLQNMIAKYLPQMLNRDYCPPKTHFHKDVKPPVVADKTKKKTGEKRKKNDKTDIRKHMKKADGGSQQQSSAIEESDDETPKEKDDKEANLKNYKEYFRELDLDIWVMLSLPLTLNPEPENNWEFKPEFGPSELLFVAEDLVEKLHYVLVTSTKRNPFRNSNSADIGLTISLYVSTPEILVRNTVKLIPRLCAHLEEISKYCKSLLIANDHILDHTGMFTPASREMKLCYALLLKALAILFGWSGFDNENNRDLFISGLTKISSRCDNATKTNSISSMIRDCVSYLKNQFVETVLHLECALHLVSLIEVLSKHCEQKEVNKMLGSVSWNFLSRHWYNWDGLEERGAAFNKSIETLIRTFFNSSSNKLKAVESMSLWLKDEAATLNNKDTSLTTLPNINKGNCNVLLKVLLNTLSNATKQALEEENDPKEKLNIWMKVVNTMDSIVAVIKIQSARVNLISFVKGSAGVLRLFLQQGIPVCSQQFRKNCTTVSQVLKTLQITTRYLQKIFDNTRLTEDSTLCAYLPTHRALLESILLKVKNIIVLNGCTEAFFVGSMRNKDLQGQDILSQSTVNEDSERMEIDDDIMNDQDLNVENELNRENETNDHEENNGNDDDADSDVILSDHNEEGNDY